MRKILVLLAIAASSVIFIGATAPAASAANCSFAIGTTYYASGNWHFQTQAQGCTDVDWAETNRTACTQPHVAGDMCGSGWKDITANVAHVAPAAYNPDDYLFGRQGVNLGNSTVVTWNIPPWCAAYGYPPGSQFVANEAVVWRIHSIATNSWGPWHGYRTTNHIIGC